MSRPDPNPGDLLRRAAAQMHEPDGVPWVEAVADWLDQVADFDAENEFLHWEAPTPSSALAVARAYLRGAGQ